MRSSIFSTYSTGENRVTASILAVLRCLSLGQIERLLGAIMEQSGFQLVRFQNQPAKGGKGVPDAEISSSCRLIVETKISRNAVREEQLRVHLKRLDTVSEITRALLVLTPDDSQPKAIDRIKDPRLVWASFASLDQAVDELLADKSEVTSEREAFLLHELKKMLEEQGLIGSASEVLVVPARDAWPEYEEFHAYVCQPNRPFRPVKRIAFYSSGRIYPVVPTIRETHEDLPFQAGQYKGRLGQVVDGMIKGRRREEGVTYKVMLLSSPEDPATERLDAPVINDLTSESGQTVAFTQNQRYVSLDRLRKAKRTSDLVEH